MDGLPRIAEGTVHIALVDTGINLQHPLFDSVFGLTCVDFTHNGPTQTCEDQTGHGTHLAGLLIGRSKDFEGLAVGSSLTVYKVCGPDLVCSPDAETNAIEAAMEDGADVILIGLAGDSEYSGESQAIRRAMASGIAVIAPVGNHGESGEVGYPARLDGVLGVGAVDDENVVPTFSTPGKDANEGALDIVAPGVDIVSAGPRGTLVAQDGTSQAAAMATGVVARLVGLGLDPLEAIACVIESAIDLTDPTLDGGHWVGWDRFSGYGVISGSDKC